MIIGICSKSGSGKSTLSKKIIEYSSKKTVHLDIDEVAHNALSLSLVKEELVKTFGESVIKDKIVNRKKLGEIVFNSRNDMDKLTNITWKHMQIEINKFLSDNKDNVVILDWILLYKTKYFDLCDIKILLDLPCEIRKKRAMKRDGITEEDFLLREKASIDFNKNDFDFTINEINKSTVRKLVKLL